MPNDAGRNKLRQINMIKLKKALHIGRSSDDEEEKGSFFNKDICKTLESAMETHLYLGSYVKGLPEQPKYLTTIEEESFGDQVNVMYPLGLGIYAHITMGESVNKYNIIEPPKPDRKILAEIETAVARLVESKEYKDQKDKILASLFRQTIKKKLVKLPKGTDTDILLYHFLREKIGHGFLDGFLADPGLEDISIPGAGSIFVYHKNFGNLETSIDVSQDTIDELLRNIAERHGKVLSYTHPIIDIHLDDGSRLNIVFGEDISLRGSNFTIRKFPKEPVSVAQLIKWHTFTAELAAYLWLLFEMGITALVCGETASGKTTTLNALTSFIGSNSKIISIEETPEINVYHKNWIREITRLHTGVQVTMFDLLKAALRQRPDYIIVGELRGEEGKIAFQAVETGHPVLSTMHAGNLGQLFQRLTSYPIEVPKSHIDGLNLVIFQARIERGNKFIRRCTSINEVIGYEPDEGRLNYLPIFMYDEDMDKFRFMGSSFHLENKVLAFRGWGDDKIRDIYEEMKARADILTYLSENFPSHTEVSKTMDAARTLGIWEVHRRVKEMKVPWV
jgi:flagellar protein FlaI